MKKAIAMALALCLALSCAACAANPDNRETTSAPSTTQPVEQPMTMDQLPLKDILYLCNDMSGQNWIEHCTISEVTAESVNRVVGCDVFESPFESAMTMSPMMNVTPFELAVFRLAEGADVQAFVKELEEKGNPRKWVCVGTDTVETWSYGQTVLFLMGTGADANVLSGCVDAMCKADFKAGEHLKQPLKELSMEDFYAQLEEVYGLHNYCSLDGEYETAITAKTGYGLAQMDSGKYAQVLVDDSHVAATAEAPEKSHLLVLLKLNAGVDAAQFAQELKAAVDMTQLAGEYPQSVIAWSEDVVVLYAGTGSYSWTTTDISWRLAGVYRMETVLDEGF